MPTTIAAQGVNNFIFEELDNDDFDFIAIVMSPFHVLGVDAFIYDISSKYDRVLKGLIFVYPHPKDGILVDQSHFRCIKFADVELVYVQNCAPNNDQNLFKLTKGAINIIKGFIKLTFGVTANNNPLYIISVMELPITLFCLFAQKRISIKYSPKFVIVDEGLGSYMDQNVWKLVNKYDNNSLNSEKKTLISEIIRIFIKFLMYTSKHMINLENRLIFLNQSKNLMPNKLSIDAYKKVLSLSKNSIPECIIPLVNKKWAIVATQPFVDYDQIEADDYIKIIRETFNLLEKNGFGIALKPHPRENIEIYRQIIDEKKEIVLLPKSTTLEDVLQLRPDVTIGLTSTVLVTSKLFYDIHSISIIDILLQSTDDPLLKVTAKQFKEKFGNIVYFVHSIDKLDKLL